MKRHRLMLTLALSLLFAPLAHPSNAFSAKKKFILGGEGGWDYLTYDRNNHRLFITRGTHVMVVDPASGQQLADIPNTPGVHGVALVPEVSKGFISAGRANQVVVFDLKSLRETARIAVGEGPDAIAYEPVSHRVFTFNARSQDATSIDTRTDRVVGTIPLQGKPEFAVANGDGQLFVNIESSGEIAELDAAGLKVLNRWPMKGCEEPTGLALDKADRILLSGCSNKTLAVVNAKDGTLVTTLPIGASVDGVSFDPELRLGFSANGEGTLTVIGQENGKWQVLQNVTTQRGARTLTLNPASHEIYVVTASIAPEQGEHPSYVPNTFTLLVIGQ